LAIGSFVTRGSGARDINCEVRFLTPAHFRRSQDDTAHPA
jgi:hypothetical protein